MTITGTGLDSATAVDFGAGNPATIDSDSATEITAAAPVGTVGTVDVTVTTWGGTSAASAADEYTYVALPTISNIVSDGGDTVTITGTNLTGATTVDFASTYFATFTVNSSTQNHGYVPLLLGGQVLGHLRDHAGRSKRRIPLLHTELMTTTAGSRSNHSSAD